MTVMGVPHLSEDSQCASTQGSFSPVKMAALNRKVGAQRAREPVTNATAVKPRVERRKLQLRRRWRGEEHTHTIDILFNFAAVHT